MTDKQIATEVYLLKQIQKNNPKVYISGPITRLPNLNKEAFEEAEWALRALYLMPVNPLKVADVSKFTGTDDQLWQYCMKADLRAMIGCGALYMLEGWKNSRGAITEFLTAKTLGIPIMNKSFEIENLTEAEYVELFYTLTTTIKTNDLAIIDKFILK